MRLVNILIASLYYHSKETMKYSEGRAVLFVAKLTFCLLLWIWFLPITGLIIYSLTQHQTDFGFPNVSLFYVIILALIYLPVNAVTWKLADVDMFVENEQNQNLIEKGRQIFVAIVVVGFVFLVIAAKYNAGTLI